MGGQAVILHDHYVVAKKVYLCDNCDIPIVSGDVYRRISGRYEENTEPYTLKLCKRCVIRPIESGGENLDTFEYPNWYEISRDLFEAIHEDGEE
jgi:hypothetical protein